MVEPVERSVDHGSIRSGGKVMELFLKRTYQPKQTIGVLSVVGDGQVIKTFKTVELVWNGNKRRLSCIPVGQYQVVKRTSEKYGQHFHILNVPGRDYIL